MKPSACFLGGCARRGLADARILLREENELNQLPAGSILEREDCIVRVATNGSEALECQRNEPLDCVLMDMQMPSMDGLTATRRLRVEALQPAMPGIPVVAMTTHMMGTDQQACFDAGMNTSWASHLICSSW
ncbi:MAG: response regulator [Pseudomonadota bacterium]